MSYKKLLAAATLTMVSTAALATPVYNGDTNAAGMSSFQTGYTIWNDDSDASSWHIRWTSNNANSGDNVTWFGDIIFHNKRLDTAQKFNYEANDTFNVDFGGVWDNEDEISWSPSYTTDQLNPNHVDGIDFTLEPGSELVEFNLGSELFASFDSSNAGEMIYLGDGLRSPETFVLGTNHVYQSFEIRVPEPGTLALLGLGLAGLGLARRKQAQA